MPRVHTSLGVAGAGDDRVKGQACCGANQVFQLLCRTYTGDLDQNPIFPLALDGRLAGACLIHTAAHNFHRLLHGAIIGCDLLRLRKRDDQHIALAARLKAG